MKKFYFFLFVLPFLFLTNCQDYPSVTEPQFVSDDGRVVATVHGIVEDAQTHNRLSGIVVTYSLNGTVKQVKTDSLGYYSIGNLTTGEYVLLFKGADDYVITKQVINVPTTDQVNTEFPSVKDYKLNFDENIELYRKNAGIYGALYAKDKNGVLNPVSNVTIKADFSQSAVEIEPAIFVTTTDENGKFSFDKNLPALNNVMIYSSSFTYSNQDYSPSNVIRLDLIADENLFDNNLVSDIDVEQVFLLNSVFNRDDVEINENIEFLFSKQINTESLRYTFYNSNSYNDVYCEISWSDNKTLTLNPYVSLKNDQRYYLKIEGEDIDGILFSFDGYFTTAGIEDLNLTHTNLELTEGEYVQDFPVSSDIKLFFNTEIDTAGGSIMLYNKSTGNYVDIVASFGDGTKKSLTINPVLDLSKDTQYRLSYYIYNANNRDDYLSESITFKTEE